MKNKLLKPACVLAMSTNNYGNLSLVINLSHCLCRQLVPLFAMCTRLR